MLADAKREGRKLVMLTAYDAGFARVLDDNGTDLVLVGDSLGMVVQGQDSTLPVTVDDIVYHVRCVARGLRRALLIATCRSAPTHARTRARASLRCLQAGAGMVKRRARPQARKSSFPVEREIPVVRAPRPHAHRCCAWAVTRGGTEEAAAARVAKTRVSSEAAGATCDVLECVPSPLAAAITASVAIPRRHRRRCRMRRPGVGVARFPRREHGHRRPKFVKDFSPKAALAGAVQIYADAVRSGAFPEPRTPTTDDRYRHGARRVAHARPRLEARRPAHRFRADDGQPARRPSFAHCACAPACGQDCRERVRESDAIRPERRLRALPAHAGRRCRGPRRRRLRCAVDAERRCDVSLRRDGAVAACACRASRRARRARIVPVTSTACAPWSRAVQPVQPTSTRSAARISSSSRVIR